MENKSALKVLAVVALFFVSSFISWQIGRSGTNAVDSAGRVQPVPVPGGVRDIGGTVETVTSSGFVLKPHASSLTASEEQSLRTVVVNEKTVMERLGIKDSATMQKEQAAFVAQMNAIQKDTTSSAARELPLAPEPFTRQKISLKDMKAGDIVFVSAGEDIAAAEQFVAVSVLLQSSVTLPATQPK